MKLSLNEVTALAAKAARGAGAPPAQAAEFGRAAARHLAAERDAQDLAEALSALPSGPTLHLPLMVMRLAEEVADGQARARIPRPEMTDLLRSYFDAQPCAIVSEEVGDTFEITLNLGDPAAPPPKTRLEVPEDLFTRISDLAARILVPESEASRRSGAGAGLTDND